MKNNKKKINFNIFILFIASICFLLVFFLKINGFLDFSGKYGIEYIQTYYQNSDSLLMIDGNKKSTWGIRGDVHFYQEPIIIKFRKARNVSSVIIDNYSGYSNSPVKIYLSNDGYEYFSCDYEIKEENDTRVIYSFSTSVNAQFICLSKDDEGEKWPISEIMIYE